MSQPLQEAESHIPWAQIVAMRNILVHEYFGVDLEEVWLAVERDLPPMQRAIEALLAGLPSGRRS